MTETDKQLLEMNRRMGGMESSLEDIKHALFGNARPGMTKRLNDVESKVESHLEDHTKTEQAETTEKKQKFSWKTAVTASAVGALISGIFVTIIEFIKYKP